MVAMGAGSMASAQTPNLAEMDNGYGIASMPGRNFGAFDLAGTQFTDLGVDAIPLTDGKLLLIAQVDVNNVDTNRVGLGLKRYTAQGLLDTTFGTTGTRVHDIGFTSIIDACFFATNQIAVMGTVGGASGTAGPKDIGIVMLDGNGDPVPSFGLGGGVAIGGRLDDTLSVEYNDIPYALNCGEGVLTVAGQLDFPQSNPESSQAFLMQVNFTGGISRNLVIGSSSGVYRGMSSIMGLGNGTYLVTQRTSSAGGEGNTTVNVYTETSNSFTILGSSTEWQFGSTMQSCPSFRDPVVLGVVQTGFGASPSYAASMIYKDAGNLQRMGLANFTQNNTAVFCQETSFGGQTAAFVSNPVYVNGVVYIGMGLQPFGTGPLTSRVAAYSVPAQAGTYPVANYGTNGLAQWGYSFSSGGTQNDNRSYISRLMLVGDTPDTTRLLAIGSRRFLNNDTDAVFARLGGTGILNDGFESGF
jgi:hypothetical protein